MHLAPTTAGRSFLAVSLVVCGWAVSAANANPAAQTVTPSAEESSADELTAARQAVADATRVYGDGSLEFAAALAKEAEVYSARELHEKALPLQIKALEIRERLLGPKHLLVAEVLRSLDLTYSALGQYQDALPVGIRSLGIIETALGSEHPDTASCLENVAGTYGELGQFDRALAFQRRALAIWEKTLGAEQPKTAMSRLDLAWIYGGLARFEDALAEQQRALAILEEMLGADHPDTASALNDLAWTYGQLGQLDEALPLQQRAVAIRERVLGLEHANTAISLNNLAEFYRDLGQFDEALSLHQRVLTIKQSALGSEHPSLVASLDNLALTYADLSRFPEALPLQQRALAIREKTLGPEHPDTALGLDNLAGTYRGLGQFDSALPLQKRSLSLREQTLGPDHPDTAISLDNLALTYANLGNVDQVLPLQMRALTIRETAFGPDHPDTSLSLHNLGSFTLRLGHPDLAIAFLKASVNAYQRSRERVSHIGADELRAYTNSVSGTYQQLAAALTDQGRLAEAQLVLDMLKEDEKFDFIRRSSNADPRRTRIDYTPVEQKWMGRYREIADRLAALGKEEQELQRQARVGLTEAQKQRQAALAADLKVAEAAFAANLDEMRKEFARKGPARNMELAESSQKSLAELQGLIKSLGDGAVLLQIYISDTRLNFLLTTPGVQIARDVTIDAKELNRQIGAFRRLLRDPKSDPVPAAQALYKLLFAPVGTDLTQAGARTVMLSLDGALRYLPFGSLHDGKQYALQRWNLPLYNSVVRERLRDAVNPLWQAAGLGVTRQQGEFSPLPGVRAEMASIVRSGNGGVLPGEVHLDEAFTAGRLKDVTQRRFPVVHVASHFQFSPGTEINSFLVLGDGTRLTLGDIRTRNYRFDNVDLLTLSACDTGLGGGRDEKGREIEGFGVIAQQQGAKAVLATLWPVADQSTAALMAYMYRKRGNGSISKIEALRQAQLALRAQAKYSHPYYWAPYILMGNWK